MYYRLKPTDPPAPRFYGLPKIHKPEIPIRPIVSYTGTPLYGLSKHIDSILQHYTKTINEDEIMVSFDVTSLYTNVSI